MNAKAKRLGFYGGTFNPVHHGHLLVARDTLERLGLDHLDFLPNHRSPLRLEERLASGSDRLEMLRLALADEPRMGVCDLELRRGGPSYTVHTLRELRRLHPDAERVFLIGADSLDTFDRWVEPAEILALARVVVLPRPGRDMHAAFRALADRAPALARALELLPDGRQIDISATDIRQRAAESRSLRWLVPEAVAAYIKRRRLYGPPVENLLAPLQMRLRGVIFDMDGVLCDSEPVIAAAACRMFNETYGRHVTPEEFRPFIGTGEDRFLGGVAARHGVALVMPRDKQRTYALYLEMIRGNLREIPGATAFVRACRARGWKTAVATSADRIKMTGNLNEIGLPPEAFDARVTGDDITRKKPDPEIFLRAASLLGLPPAECLVVEDALHGVEAAKAAGCSCLALTTSFAAADLLAAGADFVAPDLT